MKKSLALLAAWLLLTAHASAPAAAQRRKGVRRGPATINVDPLLVPPDADAGALVDRILERFTEATGGLAAMTKIRTRVMRGRAEHSDLVNAAGSVEYYSKAPNKVLHVINVPGAGQFIESYNGRQTWFQTPFAGAFIVDQTSVVILSHGAEFGRMPRAREMYESVKYLGRVDVAGRPAHLVEAVRGKHPQRLYFDAAGGLMVRADVTFVAPDKKTAAVKIFYDSYAKVDGVMIPVVFRQVFPNFTMTFRIHEVKHNVPLEDALFQSPEGSRPYQAN